MTRFPGASLKPGW